MLVSELIYPKVLFNDALRKLPFISSGKVSVKSSECPAPPPLSLSLSLSHTHTQTQSFMIMRSLRGKVGGGAGAIFFLLSFKWSFADGAEVLLAVHPSFVSARVSMWEQPPHTPPPPPSPAKVTVRPARPVRGGDRREAWLFFFFFFFNKGETRGRKV